MKEEYDFTKDKTFDVYTIEELLEQYKDNDYYYLSKIENITKLCEEIERLNKEVEKYKRRCFKGLKLIRDNYGVLDKYGLDILDDILNGDDKE